MLHSFQNGSSLHVLDVEVRPDPIAVTMAAKGDSDVREGLAMIVGACVLTARESRDGKWSGLDLATFCEPDDEFDIILKLDGALQDVGERGGLLVTYNGTLHDLPLIRRRAARHWIFGMPGIDGIEGIRHRDAMRETTHGLRERWPSLKDACAGLGISTDHAPTRPGGGKLLPTMRKCQVDVVATFLLTLYELAIERRSPDVLVAGWSALADYLGQPRVRAPHLEQFRRHPMLDAAARIRRPG